eukprot:302161-Amphidinium_carterae.2
MDSQCSRESIPRQHSSMQKREGAASGCFFTVTDERTRVIPRTKCITVKVSSESSYLKTQSIGPRSKHWSAIGSPKLLCLRCGTLNESMTGILENVEASTSSGLQTGSYVRSCSEKTRTRRTSNGCAIIQVVRHNIGEGGQARTRQEIPSTYDGFTVYISCLKPHYHRPVESAFQATKVLV